ncbi:histidinol-phosphate transaminase [Lacimicrobium alkaliphilum]|uniref:Histidinol-phosphate aminotransferase n=1 Tax=Lacimicrobium alkaliphilum TaxID=1526571 RepID=A0ABQ1RI05_9ALTE|nr:histidinol-phosphate transaminase [Lacimicrobium alkaliphilum]GGD67726.1 histidinol-phosphate aminotransferase [Lacimicrobium alkaliphilum]
MSTALELAENLQCAHLKALQPYQSARRLFSGGQDWLNANESPFSNDFTVNCDTLNRYPDCQPKAVISAYAGYANVGTEQVLVSRGADEGIELLIRAFCQPGQDRILICPPTYGMYAISAETFQIGVETAPLQTDFSLNLNHVLDYVGKVKLVFICSPNNPTGTEINEQQLKTVLDAYKDSALVVVDEAYIEFAQSSGCADWLAEYPNLVVLRTLSKAFALAGIRCGFTLAAPEIIQVLYKVIAPYPLPEPVAQIAAQALCAEGLKRVENQISQLRQWRQALLKSLENISQLTPVGDTQANFVLVRADKKQALMDHLVSQGILIRDQSKQLHLDHCLRISIGNEEQNQRLIAAITAFYQQEGQ